ncbi:TolC family protein [Picosynechococcus sp. NKBG15041c]|uniref:TolC family protein n=1 Tax=Picosynechococcus sp. NKBG15041c TaxID=1407650 RepID=UPI0003FD13EF|nr:TolC family protein [Picosynechococcus sp. NKBG15041c]
MPKLPYDLATLTQCQIDQDRRLELIAQAQMVEQSRLTNLEASANYQRDRAWTSWLTPNPIGILQNLFGGGDRQRAELQIRATTTQAEASRLNLLETEIRSEERRQAITNQIQADLDQLAQLETDLTAEQKRLQLFEIYFQRGQGSPAEYLNIQNRLAQLTTEKEQLTTKIDAICENTDTEQKH